MKHVAYLIFTVISCVKSLGGDSQYLSLACFLQVVEQPIVNFVEEDSYITPNQLGDPVPTNNTRTVGSWGIDRMDTRTNQYDGRYTPPCGLSGRGVDVYIVDSGIYYDHLQFGQRATFSGCDAIELSTNTTNTNNGRDCHGHGTWVGGIIGSSTMGVAPGANLLPVRVLDCEGSGSWNVVLLGLECVLNRVLQHRRRPAVVNLSITGASKSRAIKKAVDKLIDSGITVVGISGNSRTDRSGNGCKVTPGSIPGVITVAGTTKSDEVFNQTLLGRCVDILAPAKDIISTGMDCRSCRESGLHGSSFAAPHVTGAIALLLEKCPNLPPWKVRYYLQTKMAVPDVVKIKGLVSRKYKTTSPNLLIHTGPEMCTVEC